MKKTGMIAASLSFAALVLGAGQPQEAIAQSQMPTITLAAKAPCGGENQNSCWSPNPKNWCNAGLQYTPGGIGRRGKCIRPPQRAPVADRDNAADCGSENQKSCWNVDPKKWCNPGLSYLPGGLPGQGRCIRKPTDAPQLSGPGSNNCGNENQASCWALNPEKWCKDNWQYVPGGLPGRGRCRDPRKMQMIAESLKLATQFARLGGDNPLTQLHRCLNQPTNKLAMGNAIRSRSKSAANSIVRGCNVDPAAMRQMGQSLDQYRIGPPNRTLGDSRPSVTGFVFIEIAGGAGAGFTSGGMGGAGRTLSGSLGYAIPLTDRPEGSRWYGSSEYLEFGAALNIGADIVVGYSWIDIPTGDWADDPGYSFNAGGWAGMGGGFSVSFDDGMTETVSIAINGGVGLGAEIGVYRSNTKYFVDF